MSLIDFVDELDPGDHTLLLLDRSGPRQVFELLDATFPDDAVEVADVERSERGAGRLDGTPEDDLVILVDGEDVVATSPLSTLTEQLLFLNSDLFTTGTRSLEAVELPAVLAGLQDVPLRLRGYPESDREKLVLVLLSRVIERRALAADDGTLRTGFQRLSRLEDELGTAHAYERLAAGNVDVHCYGVPDELPDEDRYDVVHAGRSPPFRDVWFVVYVPDGAPSASGGSEAGAAALLAVETEPRTWRGFWTFDEKRVSRLNRRLEQSL